MIYPAWFDFINDDAVVDHPAAFRLYGRLLRNPYILFKPYTFKEWFYAEQMKTDRKTVRRAIRLLIARGYVLDHGRGQNNTRTITIATERTEIAWESKAPSSTAA